MPHDGDSVTLDVPSPSPSPIYHLYSALLTAWSQRVPEALGHRPEEMLPLPPCPQYRKTWGWQGAGLRGGL